MEKIFADGLRFTERADPMPQFIKGRLSIKVPDFISFLEKHQSNAGWVNITIKESTKGNIYCELDTWTPTKKDEVKTEVEEKEPCIDPNTGVDCSSIPF